MPDLGACRLVLAAQGHAPRSLAFLECSHGAPAKNPGFKYNVISTVVNALAPVIISVAPRASLGVLAREIYVAAYLPTYFPSHSTELARSRPGVWI